MFPLPLFKNNNIMIRSDEEIRKTVNVVFEKYDQNKDGYLGMPEIESYLNDAMRMQEDRNATSEEIKLFVQAADLDCDQKISKMELFKILKITFQAS
jgi:Ca2+-binding EF-hand superfamily protein